MSATPSSDSPERRGGASLGRSVAGAPPAPHPWFRSTTGTVVMSHHGRVRRHARPGSLAAIKDAYAVGYRWFQVDVVAIQDDLVSLHAVFGRRAGFRRLTLDQVRRKLGYDVPTLSQLLDDPDLRDARWNIEVKSRTALPALIAILKRTEAISRVMVSAPAHGSVVREIRETFGSLVAVTAPLHHGGTFGRRFLTPRIDHDGLQVQRWFATRTRARHGRGRVRVQSWTITDLDQLDACLEAGCHPVVKHSDERAREHLLATGRWPAVPPEWERGPSDVPPSRALSRQRVDDRPIEVLMLGGGGWRGAFGSIGAVAYLRSRDLWSGVHHVVGLSGGSFVAGALGADGVDDDDPAPLLAELARRMLRLRTAMYAAAGAAVVPPVAATVSVAWWAPGWWLLAAPTLALFVGRWTISACWRAMLRSLFGRGRPRTQGRRRYVVCATGRSSARPHFFVTGDAGAMVAIDAGSGSTPDSAEHDAWGRVVSDGWDWTDAVLSSTALPWVNGYRTTADPTLGDAGRAERLIDGGVVGIFGRQWFDRTLLGTSPGDDLRTLAIDTGRRHRTGGRLVERATGLFTVGLLSRWVQIALDASFRKEIERASRAEEAPGSRMNLVRVAETDAADHHDIRAMRNEALRRLEHGRCIVRRFGLMGLGRRNCLVTIVVSVAACMFDLEPDPDETQVRDRLVRIGADLGFDDDLAEIWDEL